MRAPFASPGAAMRCGMPSQGSWGMPMTGERQMPENNQLMQLATPNGCTCMSPSASLPGPAGQARRPRRDHPLPVARCCGPPCCSVAVGPRLDPSLGRKPVSPEGPPAVTFVRSGQGAGRHAGRRHHRGREHKAICKRVSPAGSAASAGCSKCSWARRARFAAAQNQELHNYLDLYAAILLM